MEEIAIKKKQANKYDKIIKENIESVWPVLIKDVLNLNIADSVKIPGDIQHTNERKPDVLAKITDGSNHSFILHLEWQSENDRNMAYRMAEYAIMLHRKYHLPVEQFVIFVGQGKLTMKRTIKHKHLKFRFHIIELKNINYQLFLKSENPGSKVFAILANFEKDGEDKAIENILNGIERFANGSLEENKHFNQLRILVQLRNDNIKLKLKNMISTRTFFRKEKDMFYEEGVEVGKEVGKQEGIKIGKEQAEVETKKQLTIRLKELGLGVELISQALNIPIEEVE